ncbi:AraC family transcriptional regulator of adaptative response/methylated-DNA-[protein]-cysteine methyltransferase [Pseudochelatococcus lubricantis]|uniref:AraC family transcriptional regulator of adaptative response/methylated-DNA-[protein]-cysteine methyltransferase n=1 Tax=Pseudochelatococcus lubricantis TaxID=1538102 RepID=A0ABX0V8R3_9HYPH|nr:methylated-DNA--[protein]-cysteine S-methyltransferase [Pseudochelatococcus lubricantis]NIJ60160.1 AraC family transcriptional regulator of adaptative response/methylated-DNA-[protein]-cysteine methyltransferase [Pseudochelatococcus lubricantis]
MTEQIRYAWGASSLGKYLAAISSVGLVAFGFVESDNRAMDDLQAIVPEAVLVQDEAALSSTLVKLTALVDKPGIDPGIPLDPRGNDYQKQVWSMLREIPAGTTTSYGALAAKLGTRDARDITGAIGSNSIAILIPCHRVLKKDGSISGYRWGVRRKRALLEREQRAEPRRPGEG